MKTWQLQVLGQCHHQHPRVVFAKSFAEGAGTPSWRTSEVVSRPHSEAAFPIRSLAVEQPTRLKSISVFPGFLSRPKNGSQKLHFLHSSMFKNTYYL